VAAGGQLAAEVRNHDVAGAVGARACRGKRVLVALAHEAGVVGGQPQLAGI
jgi:hypothetical protein